MVSQAICVLVACAMSVTAGKWLHPLSDEFIELINSKQNSWKAGRNLHRDTPLSHINTLMGLIDTEDVTTLPNRTHQPDVIATLPHYFDSRYKWPYCPSLNEIRDQGSCGSCWALSAVETMTDRYCIYSKGLKLFHFSAEDVVSCATTAIGCYGGQLSSGFKFWIKNGITSGGNYNSGAGCKPYSVPECDHLGQGNRPKCTDDYPTPKCEKHCVDGYNKTYEEDKRYGKKMYSLSGEDHIKAEIFQNGPVTAGFTVYSDFVHYKSGVYHHTAGDEIGGHAVKIIGWGVERGINYWLIANSWNSDWGNKGFFKILRGKNHCGIEENVVAGEPQIY